MLGTALKRFAVVFENNTATCFVFTTVGLRHPTGLIVYAGADWISSPVSQRAARGLWSEIYVKKRVGVLSRIGMGCILGRKAGCGRVDCPVWVTCVQDLHFIVLRKVDFPEVFELRIYQ